MYVRSDFVCVCVCDCVSVRVCVSVPLSACVNLSFTLVYVKLLPERDLDLKGHAIVSFSELFILYL